MGKRTLGSEPQLMWPPTPPKFATLDVAYSLHFDAEGAKDENLTGLCLCREAIWEDVKIILDAGDTLMTLEEMREKWRTLPGWNMEITDIACRALGYHGWGCARYGRPTSPKEGSGSGDSDITYLTDNQAVGLSGELAESAYRSGDTYSLNHEGNGTGEPT